MANPHHHGSTDPLHRQHGLPPVSPMQSDYPMPPVYQSHPHHFVYDNGSGPHGPGSAVDPSPPHHYTPQLMPIEQRRPQLNVNTPMEPVAPTITFGYPQPPQQSDQVHHSYYSSGSFDGGAGPSSVSQESGTFGSFQTTPIEGPHAYLHPQPQEWPAPGQQASSSNKRPNKRVSGSAASPGKATRAQYTACGACRHRRVKCDLRARQEDAEREARLEEAKGGGPVRRRQPSCSNCVERGTNCVDEYAPMKAAKQLRRGKRISEIEQLYGKSATDAALASQAEDSDTATSPTTRTAERLPELTREFFDSPFFRRFHVQRPIVDPLEFVTRYLSKPIPCATAMGHAGSVLCHCLYAWAVSYGLDERGMYDGPDLSRGPIGPVNLMSPGENETRRERDRQRQTEKLHSVIRTILREIDEFAIMRRPSWDGVRALLLILPLTEGVCSALERKIMYQAALSQVFTLCSTQGIGYDGRPAELPPSPMKDDEERREVIRMRIYWYAFVHESIQMGLAGGNLTLVEDEDTAAITEAVKKQPIVAAPGHVHTTVKIALAPIHLALACRMIHKVLTGKDARKREPNFEQMQELWTTLDQSWEEFEACKHEDSAEPFRQHSEAVHFADGWKIYLFEAHNVIRRVLEGRLAHKEAALGAQDSRSRSVSPVTATNAQHSDLTRLRHLVEIARNQCDVKARQIVDIVQTHLGSEFFEWDANLVRDGTYYAAQILAREGGTDEEVAICLQALNEPRWAFSKSVERSHDLRKAWFESRHGAMSSPQENMMDASASGGPISQSESPSFTSSTFDTGATEQQQHMPGSASWPSTANVPSSARFSPSQQPERGLRSPVHAPQGSPYAMYHQGSPTMQQAQQQQQHLHHPPLPHVHSQQHQPPPPQGQLPQGMVFNPAGQVVIQPDGSQMFVPYASMP